MALRNIGVNYEVVGISEIDKYAIKAYEAIHGEVRNFGDISKIDPKDIPKHDLFTYSFPCTDISTSGKQMGLHGGTRSGLLYECKKIIEYCKPKYLLLENVKNLVGKKFKNDFDKWLEYLESLGYTNYWKVLNSKDFGIPQNRERVFVVSILEEHKSYSFPEGFKLDKTIKDILEDNVDEKYYLSYEKVKSMKIKIPNSSSGVKNIGNVNPSGNGMNDNVFDSDSVSPTLTTNKGEGVKISLPCICASRGRNPENPNSRTSGLPTEQMIEINTKGVSNTITTVQKDNYVIERSILKYERTDYGKQIRKQYENGEINEKIGNMRRLTPRIDNISNTLTTVQKDNYLLENNCSKQDINIRKLTSRECFRLMGLNDEDVDKIQSAGISATQQYKMAGNSIVVQVMEHIFKELFEDYINQ